MHTKTNSPPKPELRKPGICNTRLAVRQPRPEPQGYDGQSLTG